VKTIFDKTEPFNQLQLLAVFTASKSVLNEKDDLMCTIALVQSGDAESFESQAALLSNPLSAVAVL
jgi:hypothetical protein